MKRAAYYFYRLRSLKGAYIKGLINKYVYKNTEYKKCYEQAVQSYYETLPAEKYSKELSLLYYWLVGEKLDFIAPTRYTEKMQWSKLYDGMTKEKTLLADKISVREWVSRKLRTDEYLPILYGIWNSFEEIDFLELPSKFVLKANHGCGFNLIVDDKEQLDIAKARMECDSWMKTNFAYTGLFELHYKDIQPKLFAEEYLIKEGQCDLPDYKFFCFDGKVFCSYTMIDYTQDHSKGKLGFFDREYNLMPYYRADFAPITKQLPKPRNYEKMIEIAETLSEGFSHVRVDLYNIDGRIVFGEMTFTTAGGFIEFVPREFDLILGEQWKLPIDESN